MYKRANPNWRPSGKNDYLPLLGDECQWYRVIIDEAQCIKNKSTKAAIGASLLKAKTRFCMTGTPMMVRIILYPADLIGSDKRMLGSRFYVSSGLIQ